MKQTLRPGQMKNRQPEGAPDPAKAGTAGTLFGLPIAEPLRHLSGQFPYAARLNEHHLRRLRASNRGKMYPKGTCLFDEGEDSEGIYVVLDGRVKLSVNSSNGKAMVLGFFGAGTILGLATAILERQHISTAETILPTTVVFVPRSQLVAEMRSQPLAAWHVAQMIAEHCLFLATKMATVELSESAQQKMVRCLLGLMQPNVHDGDPVAINVSQETIAQMVGLSRETVSRQLSRLRRNGVVDWTRSNFVIRNRRALERMADLPDIAQPPDAGAVPVAVEMRQEDAALDESAPRLRRRVRQ
jgi:CRP/FNR family cyclic AMP-dependent transcriptional regulator